MKTLSIIFWSGFFLILNSCATSEIKVNSTPSEAKVHLVGPDGQKEALGVTPLVKSKKTFNSQGPYTLEIQKEGYETRSLFVPESYYQNQISVHAHLSKPTQGATIVNNSSMDGNRIVKEVSVIHGLIQRKEFGEAQSKLVNLTTDYPGYNALWSLLGNVYFLQRKWDQAQDAYTRAAELDPNAADVRSMLERIRGLRGGN